MYKHTFYPLRSVVGRNVPIVSIVPTSKSQQNFSIVAIPQPSGIGSQTIRDKHEIILSGFGNVYDWFLPDIIESGITHSPMSGMTTMPVPNNNVFGNPFPSIFSFLNSPADIPFDMNDTVGSIFGFKTKNYQKLDINLDDANSIQGTTNPFVSNRDQEYTFLVWLGEERVIGGMCFQGYPYVTSRVEQGTGGLTLGNFGLPREIRLTPLPSMSLQQLTQNEFSGFHRSQFIDSEYSYTRQEMVSHSGLNYLCIDPVKTNLFLLTITDLPFILRTIDLDNSIPKSPGMVLSTEGYKGFAIPYIYFFEYKERTSRTARLHTGVVGVKSEATLRKKGGKPDMLYAAFPEWEFLLSDKEKKSGYILYTAHSATGQRRKFPIANLLTYPTPVKKIIKERKRNEVDEMFVSDVLKKNEAVTIFVQQGEEYERCVAGMKMLFPMLPDDVKTEAIAERFIKLIGVNVVTDQKLDLNERNIAEDLLAYLMGLPEESNFCEQINIRIYEVDPPDGVAPTDLDLAGKYANLLVDRDIDDFMDIVFDYFFKGIAFSRTSSSKYFAIQLTNIGNKQGQVVIHSMHLVRSAHIHVAPRPSKTQQVKTMHYRIIGLELGDDYSKLGGEGFNFSIDRVIAGQTKNVIYNARTLLDLLHTGGARIQSNSRRKAIEEEYVNSLGGDKDNYEYRYNDARGEGWRQSETGNGVLAKGSWTGNKTPGSFSNFSNSEARTHTELISPQADQVDWKTHAFMMNALNFAFEAGETFMDVVNNLTNNPTALENLFLGPGMNLVPTYNNVKLFTGFENVWRGIATNANQDILKVKGVKTLSSSPFGLAVIGKNIFQVLDAIRNGNIITGAINVVDALVPIADPRFFMALNCINSLGLSVSVQPLGLGLTLSASGSGNQLLPTVSHSNTFGTQGSIAKQALRSGYLYSQFRNNSYDESENSSFVHSSQSHRLITRLDVPNKDKERTRGGEIMWQDKLKDIVTGSIPLNFSLPATATKMHFRTADDALRIRFNSGFSPSIEVDFWFELTEETIKDDN